MPKEMMNGEAYYAPISTDNGNSFKFWQKTHAKGTLTGLNARAVYQKIKRHLAALK